MNKNDVTNKREPEPKNKGLKSLLFFANWLFVVFLSKKFISPPAGDLDFVLKNLGTFFFALVMTALMIHFSPRKAVIVLIPTMVILALAIAMT
jgi:hypothetical protein